MPGFAYGWYNYFIRKGPQNVGLFKTFLFPIWFFPYSFRALFQAVIYNSDSGRSARNEDDAKL